MLKSGKLIGTLFFLAIGALFLGAGGKQAKQGKARRRARRQIRRIVRRQIRRALRRKGRAAK